MRTELRFDYNEELHSISAKCTACGEDMPKAPSELEKSADVVLWLSQRYLEHRRLKHSHNVPQS